MIEIEEPPEIYACAPCSAPLVWLWSPRKQLWVAFHTDPSSTRTLHVHGCALTGDPVPSWRHLEEQDPQTIHAGAARVRQVLAAKESTE